MKRLPVHHRVLDNGLQVLVQPDANSSSVAVNLLYDVGAKHEQPHRTGFAHLFEHLMFSGSRHVPDYDTQVERAGGSNNAFTTNDLTNYYIVLPANRLETAFWLESDRMLHPAITPEKLEVQKQVVVEEFHQRYLNQPYGDAWLHIRPLMFKTHPYRWMTIGERPEHVEEARLDEVEAFFEAHYSPHRCILSVCGGTDPEDVFRLADTWFGSIPPHGTPKLQLDAEAPQTEARRLELHKPELPQVALYVNFRIPRRAAPDYLPAEIYAHLLGSGLNSRLYRHLVHDRKLATQVSAFSWELHDDGQFSIVAMLAPNQHLHDLETELHACLAAAAHTTPEDVQCQVNKALLAESFERLEVQHRALGLAMAHHLGHWEGFFAETERLQRLGPDDLQRFHEHYFAPHLATTLAYGPLAHPGE